MLAASIDALSSHNPTLDWHALAPEIILVATIAVVLLADLFGPDRDGLQSSRIASVGVLRVDPASDVPAPPASAAERAWFAALPDVGP